MASTSPNTRPGAKLPPLRIEVSDITVTVTDEYYPRALAAIKGYHRQATNMSEVEQQEYRRLIRAKAYLIEPSAVGKPSNHKVFKACKQHPCWAKYIFLHSIYHDVSALYRHIQSRLGNLQVDDFTDDYQSYAQEAPRRPPPNAYVPVNPTVPAQPRPPTPLPQITPLPQTTAAQTGTASSQQPRQRAVTGGPPPYEATNPLTVNCPTAATAVQEAFSNLEQRVKADHARSIGKLEDRLTKKIDSHYRALTKQMNEHHQVIVDLVDNVSKRLTLNFEATVDIQRIARSQADTSPTGSQMNISTDNLLSNPSQTNTSIFGTNPSV